MATSKTAAKTPSKPAAPAAKTTAVSTQVKQTAIVVQDATPDYIKQDSSRGSEQVGMEDLVIPRLEVVQGLSPALKRSDPKYIDGAQIGDLTNSVTRELYGESVYVVPVHYTKQYLVWKDKREGGGFFGAFATQGEAESRANEEIAKGAKGIEVIDTPQHLCLLIKSDGTSEEVMVPMAKTKAKISRQWNSMIRLAGGDRFSRVYKIGTAEEKNDKGDFYNYTVAPVGFPPKELYARAEELYKRITSGDKKVVMHVDDDEGDHNSEM